MDQIQKLVTCTKCNDVFKTPVVLPCGHSTCQEHIRQASFVSCFVCGKIHETENKEFVVNESLLGLITAQIASIDFGEEHQQAKEACDLLQAELDKHERLLGDLNYLIHQNVKELRNRVILHTEIIKLQADENEAKYLEYLDEYEKKCTARASSANSGDELDLLKQDLKVSIDVFRKYHSIQSSHLNQLKFDKTRFKLVKEKCHAYLETVRSKFETIQDSLMLSELESYRSKIDKFEKSKLDSVLNDFNT